jgi:polygalacturonase
MNKRRDFLKKIGVGSLAVYPGAVVAQSLGVHPESETVFSDTGGENPGNGMYYVRKFGATGDGKTMDTDAIQEAIDQCNADGGGKVYLHGGTFLIRQLKLKSNVTLYIESGAILKSAAIPNHRRLIIAENERNISIRGRGTIDANGDYVFRNTGLEGDRPPAEERSGIIGFNGCENIHVRDVTLRNASSWIQTYTDCKNILIDGITVDSNENPDIENPVRYHISQGRNSDGINLVDSEKVRISNCYISCGDDGIVMKSFSPYKACRDITITNCIVSTNASGIKIGTESAGVFEDITIQNCVVFDTRNEAIALLTADGARLERVIVSNITLRNIKAAAIGIRLGTRNRQYHGNTTLNTPVLKDVILENICGTRISATYGCNITGVKEHSVENVTLKNINLEYEGGGTIEESFREIPELDDSYPSGRVFGRIPAYGFYLRHVKNIFFDNIWLRFIDEDHRPAIVCDQVEHIVIKGLKAQSTENAPELIRLINTREVTISESKPATQISTFLSVYGKQSDGIYMFSNILKKAKQKIELKDSVSETIVHASYNF